MDGINRRIWHVGTGIIFPHYEINLKLLLSGYFPCINFKFLRAKATIGNL